AKIFAVGDKDENFVGRSARFKDGFCFVKGRSDVCAAARNNIYVKRVERFAERVVIERDRTLQERTAGERNQADAVAIEFHNEISNRELRAREAIGLYILREHAFRSIDSKKHLDSFAVCLLKFKSGLGTRQGDEE